MLKFTKTLKTKPKNFAWLSSLLVITALLSAGCSTSRERYGIAPADETGVILGSITAGSRFMNVKAVFESTDGQQTRWYVSSKDDFDQISRNYELQYGNVYGDVFAVELPAGEYAFVGWSMKSPKVHIEPSRAGITPVPFTVGARETVYIGNIHFPQLRTMDAEEVIVPAGTWAVMNNREIEDADVLYERHPELAKRRIAVRPMNKTIWRKDFRALNGYELGDTRF